MKQNSEPTPGWDWSSLVGLQDDFEKVAGLFSDNRLPQVILFFGREGIGKKLFLSKLAASFLCDQNDACGLCQSCLDVKYGRHDEVLFLETDKQYKIEHATFVQDHLNIQASSRTVQGKVKIQPRVVIMPNLDRLNLQAANRLLKSLEEPPKNCIILFSTSRPKQLLDTILSRTIQWHLRPPSQQESLVFLKKQLGESCSDTELIEGLSQAGMAPFKALSRFRMSSSEEQADLNRAVRDLLFSTNYSSGMDAAKTLIKDHKISLDDLTSRIELLLNRYYRWCLLNEQHQDSGYLTQNQVSLGLSTVRLWRKSLAKVRALSGRGGIPLNAQMIAESFALSR